MEEEGLHSKISKAILTANKIVKHAHDIFAYRNSIAYFLVSIKNLVQDLKKYKKLNDPIKSQIVDRFIGLMNNFDEILTVLADDWKGLVLKRGSTHVYDIIDNSRAALKEICDEMNMNSDDIIDFNTAQDSLNKVAELKQLHVDMTLYQKETLNHNNSVDLMQLINARLKSIKNHLPKNETREDPASPNTELINLRQIQEKIESALIEFQSIDIPVNELEIHESLGSGGFGTVYKATRLTTGEILAVKEVKQDKMPMNVWASLYTEIINMKSSHHRYTLELIGVHIRKPYRIITRFCPGLSLFDKLHRNPNSLTPLQLTALAYQVAEGMKFLHSKGIVHRDLKTMNILLDGSGAARIADFGLCGVMKDKKELNGGVGTPHYSAPEVLGRKTYGNKVDTYSYGIVLWEMLTKQIPFRDKSTAEIYDHVVKKGWRLNIPNSAQQGLRDMILRCWSTNPNDRPSFDEISELFSKGLVYFTPCSTNISKDVLEAPSDSPALNTEYISRELSNSSSPHFRSIVDYLMKNKFDSLIKHLKESQIMSKYGASSPNGDKILLLSSELLSSNEYNSFFEKSGSKIIDSIIDSEDPNIISSIMYFLLKSPTKIFDQCLCFIRKMIGFLNDDSVGFIMIQVIARVNPIPDDLLDPIIKFYRTTNFHNISDQQSTNAIISVFPYVVNSLETVKQLLPIFETRFEKPKSFVQQIIKIFEWQNLPDLVFSMLTTALIVDINDELIQAIELFDESAFFTLVSKEGLFNRLNLLIKEKKCVKAALYILHLLTIIDGIPSEIASHPLMSSILELNGFISPKLQIFTNLCLSSRFVEDSTGIEKMLQLLVSSFSDKLHTKCCLKMIAALSTHSSGCLLISQTSLVSIFSQIFLSPESSDLMTSLTILRNISRNNVTIPQLSLIVSSLMQDLTSASRHKSDILFTLSILISNSPNIVQEHYLQSAIMPLLQPDQGPVMITMALRLLDKCDMANLRHFYHIILKRVYTILNDPTLRYPELITASVDIICSISTQYDIREFLESTDFYTFSNEIIDKMEEFDDCQKQIQSNVYIIQTKLNIVAQS